MQHAIAPARARRRAMAVAGLFGLCYFVAHSGLKPLVPTNILWLLRHDWSQHYLGWAFFRQAAWAWPLGELPKVAEPDGSLLALLDANPLWSLLLKPFSAGLGPRWQFLGLFLASNFVAQGVAGAWLAARLGAAGFNQALIGALFVAAPVLLHRICHDTLTAHWLLLVAIGTFWPAIDARDGRRDGWRLAAVLAVASLTHVYLLVMALGLAGMSSLSRLGRACWREGLAVVLGTLAGAAFAVAALFALGLLAEGNVASASGFGFFSANVLSLIDPSTWSTWLPPLKPAHRGQIFEGFGYLGTGGLLLVVLAATRPRALLGRRQPAAGGGKLGHVALPRAAAVGPLLLVAGAFYVLAWSNWVFLGPTNVADWRRFYAGLGPLGQILRCTGRLVWPLGYAALAIALARLVAAAQPLRLTAVLAACLALQVGEVDHAAVGDQFLTPTVRPLQHATWQLVDPSFGHVALLPPTFPASDFSCGVTYPDKYEVPLMLFAAEHDLGINSAYLSRYRRADIERSCGRALKEFQDGQFRADTLYIVAPELLSRRGNAHLPLSCRLLDGYHLCVTSKGPLTPLRSALHQRLTLPAAR